MDLKGGYFAWLRTHINDMDVEESVKKIEGSLTKLTKTVAEWIEINCLKR